MEFIILEVKKQKVNWASSLSRKIDDRKQKNATENFVETFGS